MSGAEQHLAELRAARNRAREAFDRQLDRAKGDLNPAVLKQRAIADAKVKAMALAGEAIEIANDSRGVVIGTGAALALWLAHRPIGRAAAGLWSKFAAPPAPEPEIAESEALGFGNWLSAQIARILKLATKEIKSHD
jgi:hypothetical protein